MFCIGTIYQKLETLSRRIEGLGLVLLIPNENV